MKRRRAELAQQENYNLKVLRHQYSEKWCNCSTGTGRVRASSFFPSVTGLTACRKVRRSCISAECCCSCSFPCPCSWLCSSLSVLMFVREHGDEKIECQNTNAGEKFSSASLLSSLVHHVSPASAFRHRGQPDTGSFLLVYYWSPFFLFVGNNNIGRNVQCTSWRRPQSPMHIVDAAGKSSFVLWIRVLENPLKSHTLSASRRRLVIAKSSYE